jgi:sugar-specific transcriptional regulator TrmB
MRLEDLALLDEVGFSQYEKQALLALVVLGVADAGSLCREGGIPTSKIYRAMEKLSALGLVEAQPTRPKLFAALRADVVVDRLVEIARQRAQKFATQAERLRELLSAVPERLRDRQTFVDLALGAESHVKRHITRLGTAQKRILSYLEHGDLVALEQAVASGFPILRRIGRNAVDKAIDHRVVFGFSYQTAPRLLEFLRAHEADLRHVTGLRYSGELGRPFHVVDDEVVILPLDHPFIPEGRFASLLLRDRELAEALTAGFERLWEKAMRDMGEISFHPASGAPSGRPPVEGRLRGS